jgi:glycyl-tRNA synthetase beta subunit
LFARSARALSEAGRIVSIADRADSIVGIFAAGLRPTGNKDPFALRRAALGLARILLEAPIDVPLNRVLAMAANELSEQFNGLDTGPGLLLEVREFIVERLRSHLRELGHGAELVNAALAADWDSLPDLEGRLQALVEFMGGEAAASLAAANKRIANILRRADQDISEEIDANLVLLDEEKRLFDEVTNIRSVVEPLLERGDYRSAMGELVALRSPVDEFFDAVMVMDEDAALRSNRLALLASVKSLFDRIADLSVLG